MVWNDRTPRGIIKSRLFEAKTIPSFYLKSRDLALRWFKMVGFYQIHRNLASRWFPDDRMLAHPKRYTNSESFIFDGLSEFHILVQNSNILLSLLDGDEQNAR